MKYRRRSIEVEAFQYDGDMMGSDGKYYVPAWAVGALKSGVLYYDSIDNLSPCELFLKTRAGIHHVGVGDFIIQGVLGEINSCMPSIFKMTYEQAQ